MKKKPGEGRPRERARGPDRRPAHRSQRQAPGPTDLRREEIGMSRMRLTLLEHEGTIWTVYLSAARDASASAQLEFEHGGDGVPVRYTRAAPGEVAAALQSGGSLSRAALREELVRALSGDPAAALDAAEGRTRVWRPLDGRPAPAADEP
jgi:hypothetical protein